jgi:hypothetical protein
MFGSENNLSVARMLLMSDHAPEHLFEDAGEAAQPHTLQPCLKHAGGQCLVPASNTLDLFAGSFS